MIAGKNVVPAIVLALGILLSPSRARAVTIDYLYTLSDFSGPVPYNDVKLYADRLHDEVYAAVGNSVRVFNASGMEIYAFDHDPRLGTIFDLAVEESGDLLLLTLSFDTTGPGPGWSITRCDYRGRPVGRMTVSGFPKEFASFRPNVMLDRGGRILLASLAQFQVAAIDRSGVFQKGYDLAKIAGLKDDERLKNDIAAFSMDPRGTMLLTIPTLFRVVVVPPDGSVRAFGHAGSAPGAFGNVAGIVADDHGNVFVADRGRGVVSVFDEKLEFVAEFGSGEDGKRGLVRPTDLALGASGKLYVTQARDRGVAVFRVSSGAMDSDAGGPAGPPEKFSHRGRAEGRIGNELRDDHRPEGR